PFSGFQIAPRRRAVIGFLEIEIAGGDVAARLQGIERVFFGLEIGIFFRRLLLLHRRGRGRRRRLLFLLRGQGRRQKESQNQDACHNLSVEPMSDLRERAAELPALPGVYLYKDAYDTVIYVGKAKNLRSRVRSYFNDERLADAKTGTL